MLNGFLEAVGLIASLIGIWESVSRRLVSRNVAVRINRIENESFAVQRSPRDCGANHLTGHDRQIVVASNLNRQVFSGSYGMRTQIKPCHDLDIVAFLGT